jgi:ribosomal protein S21
MKEQRRKKHFNKKDHKPESGLMVWVSDGKIEIALRRLKKKVEQAGLMREVYDRQYFVKPSALKRKQRSIAKYKQSTTSKRGN